ncbi:hypothetical protein [Streptomyces sp. MB09-01]|uniref:hypothetical protein n=1 Tax=Streptomyces sp. MB09-01 TaxID=3028666 RepID=UPI003A5C35A8
MTTEQASETWDRDQDHLFPTIGHHFGRPGGVLIVDDTGFLKKGTSSWTCTVLWSLRY